MKKILVAGASVYGLENISDDSMLFSWLKALSNKMNFETTLICRHTKNYLDFYPISKMIPNLDFNSKKESFNKRFFGFNQGDSSKHLNKIIENLRFSDILIIGGDPFVEITLDTYKGILSYIEILVLLARFTNTPVMLHGIHFGRPPKSKMAIDKMSFILDNVSIVTTRSKTALNYLKKKYPNKYRNDILHTDDAYGFSVTNSRFLLKKKFPNFLSWIKTARSNNKKIVLLTIRTLYWLWTEKERNSFIGKIAKFLNKLQKDENIAYVFFPHCTYDKDNFWEDDRSGHNEIAKYLKENDFYTFSNRIDFFYIKQIFDNIDFAIGNRRHTGIFSAISMKKFMLFGEPRHVSPVYEDLGLKSEELFLDYNNITFENLMTVYHKIKSNKNFLNNVKTKLKDKKKIFDKCISSIKKYLNR